MPNSPAGCGRKIGPFPCCSVVRGDCLELMNPLGKLMCECGADVTGEGGLYHCIAGHENRETGMDGVLVVTDPPYGMEFRSNHRTVKYAAIVGDESLPLEAIQRAISIGDCGAYVFCRWDNLSDMPKPKSVIAWVKNNWSMGDLKHEHGRQWEACCFYPGPHHAFIERIPDVIHADRTGNELHPTQKPESLMETLIAANSAQIIIDPFCGSGTTLVAAKKLGRHFLGFEIDPKHVATAQDRLARVDAQPSLFTEKPLQLTLDTPENL